MARIALRLAAASLAGALSAAPAEAATEVVTGVISCTAAAPRSATMNGSSGVLEADLVCSGRPAGGDCTQQIRRDLDQRGCTFRRDRGDDEEVLYFTCSGSRPDVIEVIDLVCRRLQGF